MKKPAPQIFVLDDIKDGIAVLSSGSKKATVPRELLPLGAKVGDELVIKVADVVAGVEEQQRNARELLNEILGSK